MKDVSQKRPMIELKNTFYRIFKDTNPFGRMFTDTIQHKIVLCPTDGYYLSKEQFQALMKASQALNETSFYVCETEVSWEENTDEKNSYSFGRGEVSNTISYDDYKRLRIVLENALYSLNGSWGVIISHEDHGVIGGSDEFIKLFKTLYPNWIRGHQNFVRLWEENKRQYNSDTTWLPDFLKYIKTQS